MCPFISKVSAFGIALVFGGCSCAFVSMAVDVVVDDVEEWFCFDCGGGGWSSVALLVFGMDE